MLRARSTRVPRALRHGCVGPLLAALLGCGGKQAPQVPAAAPAAARHATAVAQIAPGRLVPPSTGPSVTVFATASDGSRYLISFGLRMLEHPEGSLELAPDFFPPTRPVNAVALPDRLGSGFVYYSHSSGTTLLWKSASWTARLEPLAQVDGEVSRLVPGLDRLYLQRDRRSPWVALDPADGSALDLSGLPSSPNYGAMAFADEWFGAVEVPYRGLLATFDAGGTFRPVGVSAAALSVREGELVIEGPGVRYSLAPDGVLRPLEAARPAEGTAKSARDTQPQKLPVGPLGARPLELAVLHGIPISRDAALVAAGGALGRVRLSDGAVLELRERAYGGSGACHGLPVSGGPGFLCAEPRGKTTVYAFTPPFGLTELMSFDEPRFVASNGNGALAIRGSCEKQRGAVGTYCVVPRAGQPYELAVEGDLGVERIVALDDGRAALLIPPRLRAAGSLALIEPGGGERRVALKLPKASEPIAKALLEHGFWLDGFEQSGPEQVRGWISGDGFLTGVRVGFDGKVELGKIEHGGVDRALIAGEHALVVGHNGTLDESTDGGFEWHVVELPTEPQLGRQRAATAALVNGCSRVGCSFAGWLRIGFGKTESDGALPVAALPKPLRLPATGGGRWALSCASSGEVSPAAAPMPVRMPAESTGDQAPDEITPGAWLPFWEEPAPRLPRGSIGFDLGTESEPNQLHAYVWGPPGADWRKVGQWQVRVANRQRLQGGVWSTAITKSPWGSAELAADAFGQTQNGNITVFRLLLDASGRAGILTIASRGKNELFLLEEGRAISPVRASGAVGAITGVVKLGSGYYVGATTEARTFRVYRVIDGRLEPFAEFPDLVGMNAPPALVTSSRGDALGLWTRGAAWYVYPVDLESGNADTPLEIPPSLFARLPPTCSSDEDGWVLGGSLGVEPYVDFPGLREAPSLRNIEATMLAGESELCVQSLAAQSEELIDKVPLAAAPRPVLEAPVPLTVSDRHEDGRRWGFRCAR